MTGQSLGGYRLEALLGAGGMGEVYRSHDAKLGRDVAIKILPPAFTRHPDRLARFEREARMLAALNHPNICAIYGFEEADDVRFLVLELVEGDTLAQQLAPEASRHQKGGGLPLAQVLAVARQIAEALEVAHEKGIIHRDLKPANIKITPDGAVKILDFGLAKIVGGDGPSSDLSSAPMEDGVRRAGPIIGTAAYMSPEQARGLPVDKRTRHLGLWLRPVRDGDRPGGVFRRHDLGLDREDPRARAGLVGAAGRDARADSTASAPLPDEGSEAASERYR